MIFDAENLFSENQAVTATAVSANTIDLGVARDVGTGQELELVIVCTETATAAGAATVTFEVISSASEDLSTPTVVAASGAVGKADLVAGAQPFKVRVPGGIAQRYIGLRYTVGTGPLTAGKFTAGIVEARQNFQAYASGVPVGGF